MSVFLRPNELHIKDPETKEYSGMNVVMAKDSIQEVFDELEEAVSDAEAAMETKATETIASIPEDYTALSNEVDELKADLIPISARFEENILDGETPSQWGYIGVDGTFHSSEKWRAYTYSSSDIDLFTNVKLWNGSSIDNIASIAFFSASETLVKIIRFYAANELNVFHNIAFPSGAAFAIISNRKESGSAEIYGIKHDLQGIPQMADLQSEFSEFVDTQYVQNIKEDIGFTMAKGGIIKSGGGNLNFNSYPTTCKTTFIKFDSTLRIDCGSYEFLVYGYSAADKSAGVKLLSDYTTDEVTLLYDDEVSYIRLGFKNVAETVTDADLPSVYSAISIKASTDTILSKLGKPADAKITGDRIRTLESDLFKIKSGQKYDFVNYMSPNSDGPASVSSLTTIQDYLFVFGYAEGDGESTGRIYKIEHDGSLTDTNETFTSNIGHQNTLDYCEESHCLIAGRSTTERCVYIFQNIDNTVRSFDVANAVKIDLSADTDIGDGAVNIIWAYNNRNAYDMAFLMSFDANKTTRYVSIMQLGKGSNDLGKGTIISGATAEQFNGTYQIVNTVSTQLQTIGGIVDRCNDACYHDGEIVEIPAPSRTSGLALLIHTIEDFGTTLKTKKLFFEERYGTGEMIGYYNDGVEHEGVAIYNGKLYTGRHTGGLEIYNY